MMMFFDLRNNSSTPCLPEVLKDHLRRALMGMLKIVGIAAVLALVIVYIAGLFYLGKTGQWVMFCIALLPAVLLMGWVLQTVVEEC